MKPLHTAWKLLLVLVAPLFMYNVCGKHDEPMDPPIPTNADEYFTFNISGHSINIASPDSVVYGYYNGNKNVIVSYTSSGIHNTYLSFNGAQAAGGYQAESMVLFTGGKYYVSTPAPVQVHVDNFGGPGQNITGSYTGILKDSTGTSTYPVSGTFKVKH